MSKTRQERIEEKEARLRERASRKSKEATQLLNEATNMMKSVPMGQPILIGHHSEKAHRRLIERSGNKMDKFCEAHQYSKELESKADSMKYSPILSTDSDAVELLKEKLNRAEETRDKIKEQNKELKAKGEPINPSYILQNLGAKIRDLKKKIESTEALKELTFNDFEFVGGEYKFEENRHNIYFDSIPDSDVRQKLKTYPLSLKWSRYSECWTRKHTASTSKHLYNEIRNFLEKLD